jgi:hypothetical protein
MAKIKFLLIILLLATPFVGFAQEFYKHNIDYVDSLSMNLFGNYKILEIHTYTKKQIKKYTNKGNRETNKHFKKKKVLWIKKKPGKAIEAYIIKVSDSTNYTYFIASMKKETTSKEKLVIGKTYEMELNMIRYMGEVRGIHIENLSITNGTRIPLPREAWRDEIYISPNLQGLYYVK